MERLRTRIALAVCVLALAALASGCGDDGDPGDPAPEVGACNSPGENSHVDLNTGTCAKLETDEREGTPPPSAELSDLTEAARAASCALREDLPDEGNTHVPDSEPVTYATNPPTSGDHNPVPIADGAYATPLNVNTAKAPNVRNFVHSLEHGRVEIQYSQQLPEDDQLMIKGVFDEDPAGLLLFPNNQMPYAVAATAWTALLGCPDYSPAALDAIRAFRDKYRGNGPEPVPFGV
jgi:hypothetical protein